MWVYRLLLRLYPASFRKEYGDEMAAVFDEKRRVVSGPRARFRLWFEVVWYVIRHAITLHLALLRDDVRHSARMMARAPGFVATVVLVAGLGIGATTAAFTVADLVLIRPLPFADPDGLVRVWESPPGYTRMEVAPPNYRDWRAMAKSFETMAAYGRGSANLVDAGEPLRVQGANVEVELLP